MNKMAIICCCQMLSLILNPESRNKSHCKKKEKKKERKQVFTIYDSIIRLRLLLNFLHEPDPIFG